MRIAGAGILALLTTGCLVQVDEVKDPAPIFRDARAEAQRSGGRGGRPHRIHAVVWNRDDRELVRVDVPLWMVKKVVRRIDVDDDVAREEVHRKLSVEELDRAGPGILVDVDEAQGDRVLVWLR